MSTPPGPVSPGHGQYHDEREDRDDRERPPLDQLRNLGELRRTGRGAPEGRFIAGVAGGIARHLDIDPVVVRVVLAVLVFFGGAGLVLYGVGWLFIPEEDGRDAVIRVDRRSRTVVLWLAAGLAAIAVFGNTAGGFHLPWPILIVAAVVLFFLLRRERDRDWYADRPEGAMGRGRWTGWIDQGAPSSQTEPRTPTAGGTATETVDLSKPAGRVGDHKAGGPDRPRPDRPEWPRPEWPRRARDPRKRGPILFGYVIALIALAEGILGLVDAAGADLSGPTYPGVAVAIIGAALVLGAFWGRAGGLIAIGLVAVLALAGSLASHVWHVTARQVDIAPTSASVLEDRYDFDVGEVKIDLTHLTDPADLDGRDLTVDGNVGHIRILVPAEVEVHAEGSVSGPGQVDVLGSSSGGVDTEVSKSRTANLYSADPPVLTVDASLDIGSVQILDENGSTR
ncbi:MAG: PspC domain-containing protein [Nocardioides sp.]|uniref:PspC domain-containing protein n=1 Tax=Nocardioides sp. TaxID=35761 RepID=UPI0039E35C7C